MKTTLAQPWHALKPAWIKLFSPYKINSFCKDLFADFIFLKATDAPFNIFRKYISSQIRNQKILQTHQQAQQAFKEKLSNLKLTNDWFSKNIPFWLDIFQKYQFASQKQVSALEIGSWEGLSSYFILHTLPNATLTCVDTWEGADEHQSGNAATQHTLNAIESAFDDNLAHFKDRLIKYKGTSYSYFHHHNQRNLFDLIYIDGSHHCDDVIVDAVKAFEMLNIGGILIFDDYFWQYYGHARENPAGAINAFLRMKKGSYRLVHVHYQLVIEKLSDRY